MTSKCQCPYCRNNIEFDNSEGGRAINCPHCNKQFLLPIQASIITTKSHGVFYYVFWGTISLIVTLLILGFLFGVFTMGIPAFFAARNLATESRGQTNSIEKNSTVEPTNSDSAARDAQKEKQHYIQYISISDFTAHYYNSELDGRIPGVDFKLKNTGNRIVNQIEVTIYFKDRFQNDIYEEKFYPILVSEFNNGGEPFKPGYIWQQERGKFYSCKNVPDEWREGNAEIKITNIEF